MPNYDNNFNHENESISYHILNRYQNTIKIIAKMNSFNYKFF